MGLVSLIPVVLGVAGFSIMMTREGKKFMQWYFDALEEMSNETVEYVRGGCRWHFWSFPFRKTTREEA